MVWNTDGPTSNHTEREPYRRRNRDPRVGMEIKDVPFEPSFFKAHPLRLIICAINALVIPALGYFMATAPIVGSLQTFYITPVLLIIWVSCLLLPMHWYKQHKSMVQILELGHEEPHGALPQPGSPNKSDD